MHNKVKSIANRGGRRPGRPFNSTRYPWRSISIGRSFLIPGRFTTGGHMSQVLKAEGFNFKYQVTARGLKVTRIA
jgi:hypothetical protein